jgi:type IV secretion system protein VirB11
MNAENLSLDFMKNQLFGDFIAQDGLTEIAVNRPGELHTKIRGKWRRHEVPITLRQCYAFARALASWQEDNIDDTSPILSATLESGERIQAIIPRPVSAIPCLLRCANPHSGRKRISHGLMRDFITG